MVDKNKMGRFIRMYKNVFIYFFYMIREKYLKQEIEIIRKDRKVERDTYFKLVVMFSLCVG